MVGSIPISSYTNITYDAAGNRTGETANVPATAVIVFGQPVAPDASRTLTYHYDHLNELTEELSAANPVNGGYPYNDNYDELFSYDAVGNPTTFRSGPTNSFHSDNQSPSPTSTATTTGTPPFTGARR